MADLETPAALGRRFAASTFAKVATLIVLVLLLLIPVVQVLDLIDERMTRRAEVEAEISSTWGGRQHLIGPIVSVPAVVEPVRLDAEEVAAVEATSAGRGLVRVMEVVAIRPPHYSLPRHVTWQVEVAPEVRYRGMFEVIVYEAKLRASGVFTLPLLDNSEGETPQWQDAALVLGLPDLRGLMQRASLTWDGERIDFLPGDAGVQALGNAIHAPLADLAGRTPGTEIPFELAIDLRGSGELSFLPAGEETRVKMRSSWPTPGFLGAFLPQEREIGPKGFTASWEVPYFGRAFPQRWRGNEVEASQLLSSTFGVSLVLPADGHQQTERSAKYAVLFVLLTFGVFFLLEVLSPVRLHAMHYLLVGAALVLFYVLLLAFSEHTGFTSAYAIASGATVGLITGYSRSILGSRRFAALILVCLGALYGYLFVLLRLEDASLLLGAIGLFVALATVMTLTRKLDWSTLRPHGSPAS